MNINEKIRRIRESKEWSQEQMAEKLNMSLNGYAKIERGETKLYLDKLEQIAQILDIDVVELIQSGEKNICFQIESPLGSVYQGVGESSLLIEIERLKLALSHSQESLVLNKRLLSEKEELFNKLIEQKDNEIDALKEVITLLKNK
ncbi:helix-turn-helix domain-containing protein [Actinobacillus pleuropneumoniae]|uniref:Helix-turn-helix transcriptional regulator n=1 Tax=Actinobacillus pleuropneumoniae TaxID=715 RepID=A0A9Q4DI04_ACTPL|nr:helix-turn-helix transcriptional regulator [Actinobacillus pleuropneumoniae]MCL7721468.1 helix-turn-helix domain-containing protein [Actinobacillus pleuropneumoniae]MCL7728531.1 helix-turn-helix domain-containing protein [Actinobacillus pleuropneumoniae]MCL7729470.1 helix-turn-helix domain-containing protein [Actinobacillus pleuropneumoniae]MCY6367875.1 helix-turn-helix transcriptional regulator [Actinobacillus pleuropneumoniae]MCY6384744.1 helix-turn-helix transcriptional regulator [Actino